VLAPSASQRAKRCSTVSATITLHPDFFPARLHSINNILVLPPLDCDVAAPFVALTFSARRLRHALVSCVFQDALPVFSSFVKWWLSFSPVDKCYDVHLSQWRSDNPCLPKRPSDFRLRFWGFVSVTVMPPASHARISSL